MIRRLVAVLCAALCAAGLAAAPAGALVIGIGDQKPEMFTDPLFRSLRIEHVRVVVPWDVMQSASSRADLDAWMHGAQAAGATPRSGRPGGGRARRSEAGRGGEAGGAGRARRGGRGGETRATGAMASGPIRTIACGGSVSE